MIQIIQTLWILFRLPGIRYWFYQNPPWIPGLMCLIIVRLFRRRSRIILDWHNYGYSILQVNGVNRLFVKLARVYERIWGRMWDYHLCVSENFEHDLVYNFGIPKAAHEIVNLFLFINAFRYCMIKPLQNLKDFHLMKNMSYFANSLEKITNSLENRILESIKLKIEI